jgi:hypothetical protein
MVAACEVSELRHRGNGHRARHAAQGLEGFNIRV